jgi:hypothetical protein
MSCVRSSLGTGLDKTQAPVKEFAMSKLSSFLQLGALALSLALSSAAQAQSRDTGVGQLIAQQGNEALHAIRAELQQALKGRKPVLPKPAKVSVPAGSGTGWVAAGMAATVRAAE